MIDCYSRRLVGWSIADHMRTELVTDALTAAARTRGSLTGAIFHSDHGSVYTSKDYAALCADLGVTQSMGAVGSSADNPLAEAFNATLKREVLQDAATWPEETTCRRQVFRWLTRYNTRRRHSWCRYQSPIAYETGPAATLTLAAQSHPVSKNRGQGPPAPSADTTRGTRASTTPSAEACRSWPIRPAFPSGFPTSAPARPMT